MAKQQTVRSKGNHHPSGGHRPGSGYFFQAANERALEYANEALEMARADILELQGKFLETVLQMAECRDDFGRRLFTSIDGHAQTREFGQLLWENALLGKAVAELIDRKIAEREARRPHRRAIAWLKDIVAHISDVTTEAVLQEVRMESDSKPADAGETKYPEPPGCQIGQTPRKSENEPTYQVERTETNDEESRKVPE